MREGGQCCKNEAENLKIESVQLLQALVRGEETSARQTSSCSRRTLSRSSPASTWCLMDAYPAVPTSTPTSPTEPRRRASRIRRAVFRSVMPGFYRAGLSAPTIHEKQSIPGWSALWRASHLRACLELGVSFSWPALWAACRALTGPTDSGIRVNPSSR